MECRQFCTLLPALVTSTQDASVSGGLEMRAVSSNEDADFEARVKAMKEFMGNERFKYTTRPYKAVGWERVACTCHANWSCTPHTKQMFRNSKVSGSET